MKSLNDIVLQHTVATQTAAMRTRKRAAAALDSRNPHGEHGEGVISVALAVLIMAALAAAMRVAYKAMWDDASKRTADEVKKIGG